MVGYKERMEIGYGIEKELCFHPDPRVLFSPSVKKSARKRMEEGDNVYWERVVHNSGGSLVVRHVERPSRAAGGPTVMFIRNFVE